MREMKNGEIGVKGGPAVVIQWHSGGATKVWRCCGGGSIEVWRCCGGMMREKGRGLYGAGEKLGGEGEKVT
jgi:hypothetical protein